MAEKNPASTKISKEDLDIKLTWRDTDMKAPLSMNRGSSVVHGSIVYFKFLDQVVSYSLDSKDWDIRLPKCPYRTGGVAMVRDLLTVIGGMLGFQVTNKLFTLVSEGKTLKWVEQFPPMPTKRGFNVAVTTENYVIVAGGVVTSSLSGFKFLDTVEVLDTETLLWSTAASLPHPLSDMSVVLSNENLYMLGGDDHSGARLSVFSCSMVDLLLSCETQTKKLRFKKTFGIGRSKQRAQQVATWKSLCDMPVYASTCAVVSGQLLAFGGSKSRVAQLGHSEEDRERNVYKYNPSIDSWTIVSRMRIPLCASFVVNSSENEVMVVAGVGTTAIEVATCS